MPKKVKGTTENLNMLRDKVNYIGFELEEVPEFLKEFEPLNYRVPKVYDEITYKVYKYVNVKDIEILITPKDRLDELSEKYKLASPLFTYMKPDSTEGLEKYAYFLKMINQTKVSDIQNIEKEQEEFKKEIPFEVKYVNNFKWQIYYSDYANKYFMLASTNEMDNSPMFYLLKKKIEQNKSKKEEKIFIPISNEEYTEKILKKSEIEDLENYLWYFTKNWASIYEIEDIDGKLVLQVIGDTIIYDKMTSKYRLIFKDKKEASKKYKLIKALFILSYDLPNEYKFELKISQDGGLDFYLKDRKIKYDDLTDFLKYEAIEKIKQNEKIKNSTKEVKADIKDLERKEEEKNQEYIRKEKEIVTFLECKKTFVGRIKYFFKGKKKKENEENINSLVNKDRMKDILSSDKEIINHYKEEDIENRSYTVEDIIKIGKELEDNIRENKNSKLDFKALENKVENIEKKIKNANEYLEEIDKHKKSIFEFWKYANKDESKMLARGEEVEEATDRKILKKTFDYEEDIENLASKIDNEQREKLTHQEQDALFASNFVLDGINIVSKDKLLKEDELKISSLLQELKNDYKKDIEKIEEKDFDIFGNVSQDKTKIKTLKNNKHREAEKDKYKVLNVNLNTEMATFIEKLKELRNILINESEKIEVPYDISLYKASNEKINPEGFDKFNINPFDTLEKLEKISTSKETYLYKINVPENTKLVFYSNITFFENNNQTLPLGMDISQEGLINMDVYKLELKAKDSFNINIEKDDFTNLVKKVIVYEYELKVKDNTIK